MRARLQKILSEYGICSRRRAEEMISAGRVSVNGTAAQPGQTADPDTDTVCVDGVPLDRRPERVVIVMNKPRGYLATASDERGRKTVLDLVSGLGERLYPVGRLDKQSEGVIFLTNDGEFANAVAHPAGEHEKVYRVSVRGEVRGALERLSMPFNLDGYTTRPAKVRVISLNAEGGMIEMTIFEGRNRQIRRMCEQCGLDVRRLIRISEAGIGIEGLGPGAWRYLTEDEISSILSCS